MIAHERPLIHAGFKGDVNACTLLWTLELITRTRATQLPLSVESFVFTAPHLFRNERMNLL